MPISRAKHWAISTPRWRLLLPMCIRPRSINWRLISWVKLFCAAQNTSDRNAYFSGQALGDIYAALAPSTPNVYSTAFYQLATDKLGEAFLRGAEYFRSQCLFLGPSIGRYLRRVGAFYSQCVFDRVLSIGD